MSHTPSDIVAELLKGSGLPFTDPDDQDAWPLFTSFMPDGPRVPDNAGCVTDTTGVRHARRFDTGGMAVSYGIQVSIRSTTAAAGYEKALEVQSLMSAVHQQAVVIGSDEYAVQTCSQTSPILPLGQERTSETGSSLTKRRSLFTLNFLVML